MENTRKNWKWKKEIFFKIDSLFDMVKIEQEEEPEPLFESLSENLEELFISRDIPGVRLEYHASLHKDLVRVLNKIDFRKAEIICLYSGIDPRCLSLYSKNAEKCFESYIKNLSEISFREISTFYPFTPQRAEQLYHDGIKRLRCHILKKYLNT